MSKTQLFAIVLILAFAAIGWTYLEFASASSEAEAAVRKSAKAEEQFRIISQLRASTGEAVRIQPSDADIYPAITDCVHESGVEVPRDFRFQPSRLPSIEGTGVREWQIRLPTLVGTSAQIDKLIRILRDSEFAFQVRSIAMTADEPNAEAEQWRFELEVVYLQADQP